MRILGPLAKLLVVLAVLAWIGCIGMFCWVDHQQDRIDAALARCNRSMQECRIEVARSAGYWQATSDRIAADLKAANARLKGDLPARP